MARDNLFDLFRDKLESKSSLVATDPQTLESLSDVEENRDFLIEKVADLEEVELKVDYSDFSNFVFFNSALDYFNITGEKILNEYPFDGSREEITRFQKDLDGYQRYVLNNWPKNSGHLRFDGSSLSYISVDDIGLDTESGVYRTGILSPGTGSLTIELWMEPESVITGSNEIQCIVQKISGSNGYSLFMSGSEFVFQVSSGSAVNEVKAPFSPGEKQFVSCMMDRSSFTGSLSISTGSITEFPVTVNSSSITFFGPLDLGSEKLTVCSGSVAGKVTNAFSGSLDGVKIWKKKRNINNLSSSFNVKQFAQSNLILNYRFNEKGESVVTPENSIVLDSSGKKLDGRIINYNSSMRGSGSLMLQEYPDPILNINETSVSEYILQNQLSGSEYDRNNNNIITNSFPEAYFTFDVEQEQDVLKNFLYVIARHFDIIKLHIDQFINILRVKYGEFDQAPDQLLDVVAKFFGWEFTGNFLNADAFQYILGKNVLANVDSNKEIDTKLFEIKNQFWKRTLLNLMHIYKTKGTRESVNSLLRSYGLSNSFVKLKEFGHSNTAGLVTNRIHSEKSAFALGFGSGSLTGSVSTRVTGAFDNDDSWSVESRIMFPLTSSSNITATQSSGSIWTLSSGSDFINLQYEKLNAASLTGTLTLTTSDGSGSLALENVAIFDSKWYNISVVRDSVSSSIHIKTTRLNGDEIDLNLTSSEYPASGLYDKSNWTDFSIGYNDNKNAEYWSQEIRLWKRKLTDSEVNDHTLNFQSYSTDEILESVSDELVLHWRLSEDVTASLAGILSEKVTDFSLNGRVGNTSGFFHSINPYKKFLIDYNYVASTDFGWNEDKIRIFDTSKMSFGDFVEDSPLISLEFNMIDALNEDISQMVGTLESLNQSLGYPGNRYRLQYDDLEILRSNYFKRLESRLNFTRFADLLEFFDRSFIEMVKKLIPARAYFMGDEFVVESHVLERPKVTYERRKFQQTIYEPEGRIEIWTRFGRNEDGSGSKFPIYLSGSLTE